MQWILEVLGELIDSFMGPSRTTHVRDDRRFACFELESTEDGPAGILTIRSQRLIYRTTFDRWYIPDVHRTVFEVVGLALPDQRRSLNPLLLQTVVFPALSISLLKWTRYPHYYAIHAYMDRASMIYDRKRLM